MSSKMSFSCIGVNVVSNVKSGNSSIFFLNNLVLHPLKTICNLRSEMLLFIIKQNEPLFCLSRTLSGVISAPQ